MSVLRLSVVIPTYRRLELLNRCLPAVIEQVQAMNKQSDSSIAADVLVVDNDAEGTARDVCGPYLAEGVRYIVESAPGIVAARNRALDETQHSDLLVFIDDDERPRPQWLETLVATYRETGATAVMGRVVTLYDSESVDPRIAAGDLFARERMPTGTSIQVAAAGNLLLDLRQIRDLGVRFDERLGLCGGEDTLFSKTLVRNGAHLVFCDESVADDYIMPERLTRRWLRNRAVSQGNVSVSVEILLAGSATARLKARAHGVRLGLARLGGGTARTLFGVVTRSQRHQARGIRATFRGLGMIAGAAGHRVEEYARPTGSESGRWLNRVRKRAG